MTQRVNTVPIRVKVYTDEHVMSGSIHTKPGGYKERVSDILNGPEANFIPLTDVTFRSRHDEDAAAKKADTLIVSARSIVMLIPFEKAGSGEGGE